MLPSKGFFNTTPCPFDESGYCGRFHCHYKHIKKQKKIPIQEEAKNENIVSTLNATPEPIMKISIEQNQLHESKIHVEEEDRSNTTQEFSKLPTDVPVSSVSVPVVVPSYKPTPIAELKKRHIPVFYAPSRAASVVVKKKTLPEVKKTKAEYVPESVNGNAFSFSYNPTPTASVTSVERPEYNPEISLDIQSDPCSYVPSKIGEETSAPTTVYVPEGSSKPCIDYIPGSNKTTEVPCYVPQTTISSPLYRVNYDLPDMGANQPNIFTENNKTLSSGLDNLDFAEINDEINLLQEILEEDGQYGSDEDCVKEEILQSDDTCSVSDVNTKNSTKDTKCASADDDIDNKSKEGFEIKNSINNLNNYKCDMMKNNADKERKVLINKNNSNTIDHLKTNQKETIKSTNDSNRKHKMILISDTLKNEEQNKNKRKQNSKEEPDISKRHKNDYKSGSCKNSSHHKDSSGKRSHSDKHTHKDNDLSTLHEKSERTKHKKSSKRRHSKHHSSKNNSKKRTSRRNSSHSENYDQISHSIPTHGKEIEHKYSVTILGEISSEEGDCSDGDVEIVHDTFPSIVITDSDSEQDDDPQLNKISSEEEITPIEFSVKKRIAHGSAQRTKKLKASNPKSLNPYSDLINRWNKLSSLKKEGNDCSTSSLSGSTACQQKVRIAHVPNVDKLLNAKKELLRTKSSPNITKEPSTSGVNNKPIMPRTEIDNVHRPIIVTNHSKVPLHIRQSNLNTFFEIYQQCYSLEEAREMALAVEREISERVSNQSVYRSVIANSVLRLRKEMSMKGENDSAVTKDSINYPDYTYGVSLYQCVSLYLLTDKQLASNGYPLKHPSYKNCAFVAEEGRRKSKIPKPLKEDVYRCIHCKMEFEVDEKGFSIAENECKFHWGKLKPGSSRNYSCCTSVSSWCQIGQYHVRETANEDCLTGFVSVQPPPQYMKEEDYGIYAVDCEMCYTTIGIELARVTVVDVQSSVVYDTFVLPENPIVDYCSRFSGITPEALRGCKKRLKDVQADLLKMFNSKTILIGHGLENDLKVLKLLHYCVVDTAVVYPHKRGEPFKCALRHLAGKFLSRLIQNHEAGHDSSEDAIACMDLIIMKVKKDSAVRKPKVIISWDKEKKTSTQKVSE